MSVSNVCNKDSPIERRTKVNIAIAIAVIIIGAWVLVKINSSHSDFVEHVEQIDRDIANLAAADPVCTAGRDWALTRQENNLAEAMERAPQVVKFNTAYGILTMSGEIYTRAEPGQLDEVAKELYQVIAQHGGRTARAHTPRGLIELETRPRGAEAITESIAQAYGDYKPFGVDTETILKGAEQHPSNYVFDSAEGIDVTAEWVKK